MSSRAATAAAREWTVLFAKTFELTPAEIDELVRRWAAGDHITAAEFKAFVRPAASHYFSVKLNLNIDLLPRLHSELRLRWRYAKYRRTLFEDLVEIASRASDLAKLSEDVLSQECRSKLGEGSPLDFLEAHEAFLWGQAYVNQQRLRRPGVDLGDRDAKWEVLLYSSAKIAPIANIEKYLTNRRAKSNHLQLVDSDGADQSDNTAAADLAYTEDQNDKLIIEGAAYVLERTPDSGSITRRRATALRRRLLLKATIENAQGFPNELGEAFTRVLTHASHRGPYGVNPTIARLINAAAPNLAIRNHQVGPLVKELRRDIHTAVRVSNAGKLMSLVAAAGAAAGAGQTAMASIPFVAKLGFTALSVLGAVALLLWLLTRTCVPGWMVDAPDLDLPSPAAVSSTTDAPRATTTSTTTNTIGASRRNATQSDEAHNVHQTTDTLPPIPGYAPIWLLRNAPAIARNPSPSGGYMVNMRGEFDIKPRDHTLSFKVETEYFTWTCEGVTDGFSFFMHCSYTHTNDRPIDVKAGSLIYNFVYIGTIDKCGLDGVMTLTRSPNTPETKGDSNVAPPVRIDNAECDNAREYTSEQPPISAATIELARALCPNKTAHPSCGHLAPLVETLIETAALKHEP